MHDIIFDSNGFLGFDPVESAPDVKWWFGSSLATLACFTHSGRAGARIWPFVKALRHCLMEWKEVHQLPEIRLTPLLDGVLATSARLYVAARVVSLGPGTIRVGFFLPEKSSITKTGRYDWEAWNYRGLPVTITFD